VNVTKHLIVQGRVQGVGFRESMRSEAKRCGVTGWVRNRHDGTVEAVVHGSPGDVARILEWARRGPPAARVTSVDISDSEAQGEFDAFDHRPSV
jgi:acylphosphatase